MEQRESDGTMKDHSDVLAIMAKARDQGNEFMTNSLISSTLMQFFLDG